MQKSSALSKSPRTPAQPRTLPLQAIANHNLIRHFLGTSLSPFLHQRLLINATAHPSTSNSRCSWASATPHSPLSGEYHSPPSASEPPRTHPPHYSPPVHSSSHHPSPTPRHQRSPPSSRFADGCLRLRLLWKDRKRTAGGAKSSVRKRGGARCG